MYQQQASLSQENHGLIELEQYANAALPEDYEITEVLDDVIMGEYADLSENGKEIIRNGIYIPEAVAEQKAWRVGRVILAGPNVRSENLKVPGTHFIFPGDRGIRSFMKNGKQLIFINEARLFGVCSPKKQTPLTPGKKIATKTKVKKKK
jgi:hypothetical protein